MVKSGIYLIRNKVNDKKYVGSTMSSQGFDCRWSAHKSRLRNNYHKNPHLQRAWNKYGEKVFEFLVLEQCSDDMLLIREDAWIEYYKSRSDDFGYNLRTAERHSHSEETKLKISLSHKGIKPSEETRQKMREQRKGRKLSEQCKSKLRGRIPWNKGKVNIYSDEVRNKISESLRGKKHSEETKRKMSESRKGKNYGYKITEETRRKMSIARMGKTPWNKGLSSSKTIVNKLVLNSDCVLENNRGIAK